MTLVSVGRENGADIEIYFEDHGSGPPVVLTHGFPFTTQAWERQECVLVEAGFRVVAYDRRGFGRSSRPMTGYDYDTLAADLAALVDYLDLTGIALVGFGLGTGEVARYIARYGSARLRRAILIAALPPFLRQTPDNPDGLDDAHVDGIRAAVAEDRFAYLEAFLSDAYNADALGGLRISDQAWHASFVAATSASAYATRACAELWLTDFRPDLARFDIPTLVVHGTDDRIVPAAASAHRLAHYLPDVRVMAVDGGPHTITWTHPDEVNAALLAFLAE